MIIKDRDEKPATSKLLKAGEKAEKQMAYYLERSFGASDNILVLNDLRLVNKQGLVAQIDHLIIHTFGFIVVESKSVTTSISINEFGEWTRYFNHQYKGMKSPIKQAELQIELLKEILEKIKIFYFETLLQIKYLKEVSRNIHLMLSFLYLMMGL